MAVIDHAKWRADDGLIVPLVALAFAGRVLVSALFRFLVKLFDFVFPLLLQIARFPLFTMRILGDAVVAIISAIVRFLPVSESRRNRWQKKLRVMWVFVRSYLSYHAFEEAVHRAFETGMAFVFRKCRGLTPSGALLVIVAAVLWLPVSLVIATALHAVLIAKALVLPAWFQLLHPLATFIAKSKLLVLPVYPAAWPQAKRHPLIQGCFAAYRYSKTLYLFRKGEFRYRQIETGAAAAVVALGASKPLGPFYRMLRWLLSAVDRGIWSLVMALRRAFAGMLRVASAVPLVGPLVQSYARHYKTGKLGRKKPSEAAREFFARWSVRFSAKYYEGKDNAVLLGRLDRPKP
jgi:hypothetical protein